MVRFINQVGLRGRKAVFANVDARQRGVVRAVPVHLLDCHLEEIRAHGREDDLRAAVGLWEE